MNDLETAIAALLSAPPRTEVYVHPRALDVLGVTVDTLAADGEGDD